MSLLRFKAVKEASDRKAVAAAEREPGEVLCRSCVQQAAHV